MIDHVFAAKGAAQRDLFRLQRRDAIGAVQLVMAGPFVR